MAGYSTKTLQQKLGYKPGMKVCVLNAYESYLDELGVLPNHVVIDTALQQNYNLIHCFTKSQSELINIFSKLLSQLASGGMIWISWPKKAAKIATDVDENSVRNLGLALGIVDVKVCAVNEIWSGLKFLRRKT